MGIFIPTRPFLKGELNKQLLWILTNVFIILEACRKHYLCFQYWYSHILGRFGVHTIVYYRNSFIQIKYAAKKNLFRRHC